MSIQLISPSSLPIECWDGTCTTSTSYPLTWQTFINTANLTVGIAYQSENHLNSTHYHSPYEHFIALKGTAQTLVNNQYIDINQGDTVFLPSNTLHTTLATSTFECLFIFNSGPFCNIKYHFPSPPYDPLLPNKPIISKYEINSIKNDIYSLSNIDCDTSKIWSSGWIELDNSILELELSQFYYVHLGNVIIETNNEKVEASEKVSIICQSFWNKKKTIKISSNGKARVYYVSNLEAPENN